MADVPQIDERRQRRATRLRRVALSVLVFFVAGALLPVTIPANSSGSVVESICKCLFWVDTVLLPSGTPDSLKILINILSCGLWGVVAGFLVTSTYSLRTLAIFTLLCTCGFGLWWHWAPWREETVFRGHAEPVVSAAFSPDGSLAVTASQDTTARIWDAHSGRELRVLKGHKAGLSSAAFSSDGSRVVTAGSDGTARVWDVETGTPLKVIAHSKIMRAAFYKDSETIVTARSSRDAGTLWDVGSAEQVGELPYEETFQLLPAEAFSLHCAGGPHAGIRSADGSRILFFPGIPGPGYLYGKGRDSNVSRVYRRTRPSAWWGVFYLCEFWLTVAFGGLFIWSVVRDRKSLALARVTPSPLVGEGGDGG